METCEICGIYSGEKAQLHGHKLMCRKRTPEQIAELQLKAEKEAEEPTANSALNTVEGKRRTRTPFGSPKQTWNCPKDDGFHYRVFNDNWSKEPGRVQRALNADYVKVENSKEAPVGANDDGSPIMGVKMRIPQELFDEDQAEKQKEVDKVDEAIRKGTFQRQAGDNRYIPDGIKIWDSNNENK